MSFFLLFSTKEDILKNAGNQTLTVAIDLNSMEYIIYIHCKYHAIKCVITYIQVTLNYKNIISIISTFFIRSGLKKKKMKKTLFTFCLYSLRQTS